MRLITWNCNGAFRKKFHQLEKFDADILIIQECEDPKRCTNDEYINWSKGYLWTGENKNKGLAIFFKNEIIFKDNGWDTGGNKYFISAKVNDEFDVIAVWNHYANSPNFRYIGQFWKYLQLNKSLMGSCVIAGDFNSNKIWDEWDRWWNHSDVVRELNEIGIRSLYHEYFNEAQGEEKIPTLFLQRNIQKPYHIDYAFATEKNFSKIKMLEIGKKEQWLEWSDHMPVVIEF